jgi:spore germination protein
MEDRAGISSKKAEEYCKKYFADYSIAEISYAGETLGKGLKAYNFEMRTENDVSMFAQISQNDGALIYFDYYEECNTHLFDVESAKNTAIGFLEKLGYENMIPVAVDESGTNADFTFAYYADGCTYYPDEIVVKVCEQRGIVSGLDASKYLKNHRGRIELNAKITMQQAREKLSDKLTVESSRLVLFEHKGREIAAYEFFCAYGGQTYFIYLDADDGRELYIVNSKDM